MIQRTEKRINRNCQAEGVKAEGIKGTSRQQAIETAKDEGVKDEGIKGTSRQQAIETAQAKGVKDEGVKAI